MQVILAYSNIKLVKKYRDFGDIPPIETEVFFCPKIPENNKELASELVEGDTYAPDSQFKIMPGSYIVMANFRENLKSLDQNAFNEFINAPKGECVFGPDACKRISQVFNDYHQNVSDLDDTLLTKEQCFDEFLDMYDYMVMAFNIAAKNGAVEFG